MLKVFSKLVLFLILLIAIIGCTDKAHEQKEPIQNKPTDAQIPDTASVDAIKLTNLEIPSSIQGETVIHHMGYTLSYNETYEQANWVAYELTEHETNRLYDRTDMFLIDPNVRSGTATDADYKKSGYDRGHLAPAADMGWSATTMAESFYYSNMSPQLPGFNRGVWKRLEELVRAWAVESDAIFVVTGPVLSSGLNFIGWNQVAVPKYYYKVILDYRKPDIKAIGFILPNASSGAPLQDFAVSIDKVEQITGIDFFHLLPDNQENILELSHCTSCWSWKGKSKSYHVNSNSSSVQCSGITQAGNRCQRMTKNPNGKCFQHD